MGLYIKTSGGTWSPAITAKIKTGASTWSTVIRGFVKTAASTWSQFFPGGLVPVIAAQVTIAKSGSGTITLTGTNRRWTNFSTGVYFFDSSTDNSNWTQMVTGSITNPAVGGTNTKTYALTQSDVTANTTNYYRFRVEVTSSTPVTATSTSTSVTVEGTRDITDLSATASLLYGSIIDLSWTASVYAGSQVVQYKLASSGTWTTFSTASGIATSASVTGLTGGGISYNFRILPYTGASATGYYGNYSNTATASTYAGNPYTFNFGNTIYIGTNGYISFDYGRIDTSIGLVLGRALSMLAADLVQDFLSLAASGSMQYIFWRGHRYGNANTSEIRLEIQIPNAGNYAYIEYTFTTAVSPRNSSTISTDIGYYVDGVGPSGGYSNISSSILTTQQVLIYFGFGTSSGPGSGIFSSQGISWAGWIAFDTVTSGGLDDGYYALTTVAGSSPSAPTSVSNSSVTGNSASISWSAPSSLGGSKILSYDYSTDQVNWINTGLTTSATVTGLSGNTNYTVYVRANNHFFTGTNYGTTSFTTLNILTPPTITNVTAGNSNAQPVVVYFSGGSGPYYQMWWQSSASTPSSSFTPDAYGASSPLTDSSGPGSAGTYYAFVRSVAVNDGSTTGGATVPSSSFSDWSSGYAFTVTQAPIIPTISGLNATSITTSSATISWSSTNQATYSISGGPVFLTGSTATSVSLTGLSSSTFYNITVTVFSSTSDSASASVGFTTSAPTPTPNISSIALRNGGGSTASPNSPRMQATITSTNAASISYTMYTSSTLPIGGTVATSSSGAATSGSLVVTTNSGAFNNYYEIYATPWSGAGGTGISGTTRYAGTKRNTTTATTTTTSY